MTRKEFSNQFTELLNSYANQVAFGDSASKIDVDVDEYEKSLALTQAQEDITISLYTGKNAAGDSFESSEEIRRYLAPLITEAALKPLVSTEQNPITLPEGMTGTSKFFKLPQGGNNEKPKVLFITYEAVSKDGEGCEKITSMEVVPVTQDEYHRVKKNPFRGANDRKALRLDLSDDIVEIISTKDIESYYIRYIRKPKPIVLIDLPDSLSIEGINKSVEPVCELPEILHQRILEAAVRIVLQSKMIGARKE